MSKQYVVYSDYSSNVRRICGLDSAGATTRISEKPLRL